MGCRGKEILSGENVLNNKVTIWQVLNSHQSDINWCDRRDYGILEDRGCFKACQLCSNNGKI